MATQGFAPPDGQGLLSEEVSMIALLSFIGSIFGSALGMTKFILDGPLPLLSKDRPLNGMISLEFALAFFLNLMFGLRVFVIEFIFFTSYADVDMSMVGKANETDPSSLLSAVDHGDFSKTIEPILPPEYRLITYLAPSALSFGINLLRVATTSRNCRNFFLKYPQFIISPMFSPFMYEGCEGYGNGSIKDYQIRVWKAGSLINAFFIGVVPQIVLIFSEFDA